MKFSFNRKAEINQSLDIVVPNKEVEKLVADKLKVAQKDAKLKGFRKGKAPLDVVTNIYGPEIRQEVIFDLATKSFHKQAEDQDLKIVSRPNLIPEKMEEGKDVKTLFEYDAINITLGLPFIRISPDHGPNEKMIGKNISNPLSLIRALEFLDKN